MMEKLAHYLSPEQSAESLRGLGVRIGATEFARVRNLEYVWSPDQLYPLSPRVQPPLQRIVAFTVDMDGTSTTTEPLALHALEYMVRRITALRTPAEWPGLDPARDYPHVIGNSNFRHTEFLVRRYRDRLNHDAFRQAFFEAVAWTLANMTDPQRRRDITRNAGHCGLGDLLADREFQTLIASGSVNADNVGTRTAPFVARFGSAFRYDHFSDLVSAALDIYYMRYHAILRLIEQGQGARLSRELLGDSGRPLIAPMPGYDVFIPLVKGWLGSEADALFETLRTHLLDRPELGHTAAGLDAARPRLARLADYFRRQPAKVALVTASIAYEARAGMKEVIRVAARQVRDWPVPAECRDALAERWADEGSIFDAVVCASDACEHRLKPHPDLYSLALYRMSIPKTQYAFCVGLEDTEPGIIALRAAGIGCAVALPNRDTSAQDYSAAAEIINGGLPELILVRNLLLPEK